VSNGWITGELKRIWKEATVAFSRCDSSSCFEIIKKTASILGQSSRPRCQLVT